MFLLDSVFSGQGNTRMVVLLITEDIRRTSVNLMIYAFVIQIAIFAMDLSPLTVFANRN